jgi:hypothetical protein
VSRKHEQTAEADRITSDGDIICVQSAFDPRTVTVFQEKWSAEIVLRGAFRGVVQCMSFRMYYRKQCWEEKGHCSPYRSSLRISSLL